MCKLKRSFKLYAGVVLTLAALLVGCAGQQLEVEPIEPSENPQELINELENEIAMARQNQIHVLSPTWFAKAESSLDEAKKAFDQREELSQIYKNVANGRAELKKAREFSEVSRLTLPDAIESRNLARTAGATSLGEDYIKTEQRFLDLTRAVEKDNLRYAQRNQAGVIKEFNELEIRAIKFHTIGKVRQILQTAKERGAPKIAPTAYTQAQQKLLETDAFITENPYAKEERIRMANEALFLSKRVLVITEQCEQIEEMQPEPIVLWVESILDKTARRLAAPDMRDQPFDKQVENILETISAQNADRVYMKEQLRSQQNQIESLQTQIATLESKSQQQRLERERLMAAKRFNEMFSEVQTYFKPSEAEIYKRENQLIIRLKAMKFPVGQSVIMPVNYALLSKVQRSIRLFGEPDVIIGGHTDSTGSNEVNDHLSQQRADAVRQYLVANGTLPYDKIIAVGYGSMRPIASNATEEGRAMNRRIDITITPEVETQK